MPTNKELNDAIRLYKFEIKKWREQIKDRQTNIKYNRIAIANCERMIKENKQRR